MPCTRHVAETRLLKIVVILQKHFYNLNNALSFLLKEPDWKFSQVAQVPYTNQDSEIHDQPAEDYDGWWVYSQLVR